MKTSFIKNIAQTLVLTLFCSILPYADIKASAHEYTQFKLTQDSIEKITGTDHISKKLSESKKYIAIADGTNSVIKIPHDSSNEIALKASYDEDKSNFNMYLPKESKGLKSQVSDNGTVIYANDGAPTSFGVQAINDNGIEGVRALITIQNSDAAKEYSFKFDLENGAKLVTDTEYLGGKEYSNGEIYIVNKDNIVIGSIDKPWAYDANGKSVKTYYKIKNNNELVQVINFTKDSAFPIVADPSAWQITKCAGSIAWAIGSTVFAAAKLVKIKKYIAALGGIREAAALLVGATTYEEKLEVGGTALVSLAAEISGVKDVYENCLA